MTTVSENNTYAFLETLKVGDEVALKAGYVYANLFLVKVTKVQKQKIFVERHNGLGFSYEQAFRRKDGSVFSKEPYSLVEATSERRERIRKDEVLKDINRLFREGKLDKLSLPQLSEIASILSNEVNKA